MSTRFVAVAALILGAACASAQQLQDEPVVALAPPDSVFIEVINDNYYDARIHVIYDGGARYSLGTIAGNQRQAEMAIPWQPRSLVAEVTLIIQGGVYLSDVLDVAPGDLVQIRLPPDMASSAFFRRVPR